MREFRAEGIALKNLSLPERKLVLAGLNETRDFLRESGFKAGLDVTPVVRSRFYAELGAQALHGTVNNMVDGEPLVSSLSQSFAQRLGTIRTPQQIVERALMPPVMSSLGAMVKLQHRLTKGDQVFYANLYTEELAEGNIYTAPFIRAQTLTADLLVKGGYSSIEEAIGGLRPKGIEKITYDTNAIMRPAQVDPERKIGNELEVLEQLIQQKVLGQFVVSLCRGDIRYPRQNTAKQLSYDQATEILSGDPREAFMGPLPDMLELLFREAPSTPVVLNFAAKSMGALRPGISPQRGFRAAVDYIESKRAS